jgi:NADPH2 dehydrogenase
MAGLADEVRIGAVRLRNRMVLPPITTKCAAPDGTVTEQILRFYGERSRDVGLVVVEATAVRADGRIVPESLGLWDDMQIEGMARLSDKIRRGGAVPVVQLNHAGARCFPLGGELQGASPSGVAFRADNAPFAVNRGQIDLLVSAFADAAARAVSAGFAGVEIHGAHFYLVSQFLSPLTNRRDDEYGGDARFRAALAVEIVKAVRARVGRQTLILFRLNAK